MKIPAIFALLFLTFQAQAPTGVIEGRVVHPGTRDPIADVLVTLLAPVPANATANLSPEAAARLSGQINALVDDGNRAGLPQQTIDGAIENARRNAGAGGRQLTVLTDASGHFSFRDLAPGRYTVRAEREGYFALPTNGTSSTALTKTYTMQEGKPNPPDDLLMVKGAVISGRIREPNGQPISSVQVSVYRVTYTNGRKVWTVANTKTTDDLGEYRAYWLAPGEYFVGVTPRAPGVTPGPQDTWARTFFPGTVEPSDATAIVLKDGSEAAGTDINIRTGSTALFKISGVAINSFARPNPSTGAVDKSISSFVLSPHDPGVLDNINPPSMQNALPVASRQNGEFEIRNVRAGSYDLFPMPPAVTDPATPTTQAPPGAIISDGLAGGISTFQVIDPNGLGIVRQVGGPANVTRRQPTSRTAVDVRGDIRDLRIVVNNGATLSGQIVINGTSNQTLKFDSVRLTLRSLDTLPASLASLVGAISVDASGNFTVPNVPEARYTIQMTGLPASAYIADIRQAGASVMDNGFVVDPAGSPVQIVVEPNGVTVQGVVQNADGKPAANATVVLVPPSSRRQNSLLYRNVVTNENGAFSIKGVPQGQFTVYAWENVLPTSWQNAEFLSKNEGRGRPLNITSTSTPDVQLSLIPSEDRR